MTTALPENPSIEEVREYFSHDSFASKACGCTVVEAQPGRSVCQFEIGPQHRNAQGNVMGGAIFTLADFALAIACNINNEPTVAVSNTIEFMSAAKGARLIATCTTDKSGRALGFYTVFVEDELSTPVAKLTATCFRRS